MSRVLLRLFPESNFALFYNSSMFLHISFSFDFDLRSWLRRKHEEMRNERLGRWVSRGSPASSNRIDELRPSFLSFVLQSPSARVA